MKKTVSVLIGISVFMGVNGLSLFTATNGVHVEAAMVTQQNVAYNMAANSKSKSSLMNMKGKYDNATPGRRYGTVLPREDKMIAGVIVNANPDAIMQSLGKPDSIEYQSKGGGVIQVYGGITYYTGSEGGSITVVNRDAVTARGVAVGDTLEKVYSLYGQPDQVSKGGYSWFYGAFSPRSGDINGIEFIHDGNRITKIVIWG